MTHPKGRRRHPSAGLKPHLSRLPYEIRQQIFTHILTFSVPITFDGRLHSRDGKYRVERILPLLGHIASGAQMFWSRNIFHISAPQHIPSFLSYATAQTASLLPREYVTQLQISINPLHDAEVWQLVGALRLLLSCHQLRKVELQVAIHCHIEECEDLFYQVREAALELGQKLGGDEGLIVALNLRGETRRWMIEDFRQKEPPSWPSWEDMALVEGKGALKPLDTNMVPSLDKIPVKKKRGRHRKKKTPW
ncbi:MAG: hypothetical protein Q9169_007289 [Polycauliona sp. 2 TL-2023]